MSGMECDCRRPLCRITAFLPKTTTPKILPMSTRPPPAAFTQDNPVQSLIEGVPDSASSATPDPWLPPDGFRGAPKYIEDLDSHQAVEEMTCTFNMAKMVYLQHVRFALGGNHQFSGARAVSPKAIQAVWGPSMATADNPELPDWVELSKIHGSAPAFQIRIVALNYAVGRIARLARSSWNAILANDLLEWAEHIDPAAIRIEHPYLPRIYGATIGRYAIAAERDDESDAEVL
ncbi:hypothetical protein B0H14DRAFT_2593231 [Mycena olivaceomarginata]|nr:hypothetical protein B0H14DRAFT_2593231 [Mycena olivaceomarginata]